MKRIEYIDAMRGFNMILIVMAHIVIFSYGCISGFSWSPLFTVFRLPIFFFISGFVMYKIDRVWSVKATFHYLKDKAKVLLIPFIAFFSLYTYYIKGDFWEGLCYDMKNGYWFTFALFEYYVIYVLIMLFLSNTFTAIRGG